MMPRESPTGSVSPLAVLPLIFFSFFYLDAVCPGGWALGIGH